MTKARIITLTLGWALLLVSYVFWAGYLHPKSWDPHNFREIMIPFIFAGNLGYGWLWSNYLSRSRR